MVRRVYVGMDGGGTKIKVKLADESGDILTHSVGGPAQIRYSVDQAWQSVYAALDEALAGIGLKQEDPELDLYVCMGLAGCEVLSAKDDFLSRPHSFKQLLLFSDAYVACIGAHMGQPGGIIIIGTGVIGMSIVDQQCQQVGGWGFPHDDMGGGAWLGLEAMRCCLQSMDGRLPPSVLSESILEHFDFDQVKLVEWATSADAKAWGTLAPLVVRLANNQDPDAIALLEKAASHVSCLARALLQKSKKALPLAFFGGISSFVLPYLDQDIKMQMVERQADAEDGALLLIQTAADRS